MPVRRRRSDHFAGESPDSDDEPGTQRRRTVDDDALNDDDEGAGPFELGATQADGLDELVKKLVRLALACEYQRRPIRRTEINEKVLGASNSRQFRAVWSQAQIQLRNVFGLEMVELPAREKITLQQRRAAQKAPVQAKTIASWTLCTILPPEYRNPAILQPSAAPTAHEESVYTGIYTLLVSLISLSGGRLPDAKMERCLARLSMEDRTPLPEYDRTEKLMKRMERDGYLTKVKENSGAGEDDIYWVIGPRGKVEVGDDGVRGLVKTVHGDLTEVEEEELEHKIARSLGLNEKPPARAASPVTAKKRGRNRGGADADERAEDDGSSNDDNDDDD